MKVRFCLTYQKSDLKQEILRFRVRIREFFKSNSLINYYEKI